MTTHSMIDIETLGTSPNCAVLTIGGVKFNPYNKKMAPHSELYLKLDIDEQISKGREVDQDVLEWWATQDDSIILESFGDENRDDVLTATKKLKKWFVGCDAVWAHGVAFDIVILENLFKQYEQPIPWAFWMVSDSRTLFKLFPYDLRKKFDFDAHNALEDAKIQAICVQQAFEELNLKG